MVRRLESEKIQTRMLFAGNILKHPCFDELRKAGRGFRVAGSLENTDIIMSRSFWVGVYPGMDEERLRRIAESLRDAAKG